MSTLSSFIYTSVWPPWGRELVTQPGVPQSLWFQGWLRIVFIHHGE